jgi:hypothetical protein
LTFSPRRVRSIAAASPKALRERLAGRMERRQDLGVAMFARGCSTHDSAAISQPSAEGGAAMLSERATADLSERQSSLAWRRARRTLNAAMRSTDPVSSRFSGTAVSTSGCMRVTADHEV